jgi:membrane-associated phospholipid phosphatase
LSPPASSPSPSTASPRRAIARSDRTPRPGRRAALAGAAALCLAGALALAGWVGTASGAPEIDRAAARAVHANRVDDLDPFWRGLALVGGSAALGVVVMASCVFAWKRGGRRWLAFLLGSYVGAEILFWAMKAVVGRPRPPESLRLVTVGSASYPSGHTAIATAVSASLMVAAWRSQRIALRGGAVAALVALPLAVGLSRLALGVHWLTDVAGGALLGLGWVLLLAALLVPARERGDAAEAYGGRTGRPRAPYREERAWDSRSSTSRSPGGTGSP